jgi:hypothetical protein
MKIKTFLIAVFLLSIAFLPGIHKVQAGYIGYDQFHPSPDDPYSSPPYRACTTAGVTVSPSSFSTPSTGVTVNWDGSGCNQSGVSYWFVGPTTSFNASPTGTFRDTLSNTGTYTLDTTINWSQTYDCRAYPGDMSVCGDSGAVSTSDSATATYTQAQPATVTVDPGICPAGTTWSSSTGDSSSPFNVTPPSNGTLVTISPGATPAGSGYVFASPAVSPSSQMVYPGGNYRYTLNCIKHNITLTLSASPNPYMCSTGTTLSWATENADSCSAQWTNSTATSGRQNVVPNGATNYSMTCSGSGENVTQLVSVGAPSQSCNQPTLCPDGSTPPNGDLNQCPSTPAQTASASITATPTTINSGQTTSIHWTSTNTSSCTGWFMPQYPGAGPTSGTISEAPVSNTTYNITCTSSVGGTNPSASASVTVNPAQQQSSSLSISSNNPSGSWTIAPDGLNGSGTSGGPYLVTPISSGSTYTITPGSVSGMNVQVTNSDGGGSSLIMFPGQTKSFSITYNSSNSGQSFDYSLSAAPNPLNTVQGGGLYNLTITKTALSGTQSPVALSVGALPAGVSVSGIQNNNTSAPQSSVITFSVSPQASVTAGTPITITGTTQGGPTHTAQFNLVISQTSGLTVSCQASPSPTTVGTQVTWTAYPSGGTPPYTYTWSGTNLPTAPAPSTNPYQFIYQTTGSKTTQVTVTDQNGTGTSAQCPVTQLQVNVNPTFQEF